MKPIIAMILAASVAGCLTASDQLAGPATTPASPSTKYDASWHRKAYWPGEYPAGFSIARDMTVNIRPTFDPDAPKSVFCDLKKGATYHQWNEERVASDQLEFVTFSKIVTYELKEDYTANLERESGSSSTTIEFKKGDRWLFLADIAEGEFILRVGDTTYTGGDQDLVTKSTQVRAPASSRLTNDRKRKEDPVQLWLKLKCANGAVGWIFYDEVVKAPGFSRYDPKSFGHASDLPSRPRSRSAKQ